MTAFLEKRHAIETYTYPTKFGKIVQDLALVRIGVLFFKACARFGKATKKGPFEERCGVSKLSSKRVSEHNAYLSKPTARVLLM